MGYFLKFIICIDLMIVLFVLISFVWFKFNGKDEEKDMVRFRKLSVVIALCMGFVGYTCLNYAVCHTRLKSDLLLQGSEKFETIYVNQKNDFDSRFLCKFFDNYVRSSEWGDYYDTLDVSVWERKKISNKDCIKTLLDFDYTRFYKCDFLIKDTTGHLHLSGVVTTVVENGITFARLGDCIFAEGELLPLEGQPTASFEIYYDKTTLTKRGYITKYSLAGYYTDGY